MDNVQKISNCINFIIATKFGILFSGDRLYRTGDLPIASKVQANESCRRNLKIYENLSKKKKRLWEAPSLFESV
jgi:hypothetical protein